MNVWHIVSIPFWLSGAALAFCGLRAALRPGDHIGDVVLDMLVCGLFWYVAARIAGA